MADSAEFAPSEARIAATLEMAKRIRFGGRHFSLPSSRAVRVGAGLALVGFGLLGFLPVLGFWMIPLGLLVLSVDLAPVRRWRRRLEVRWSKWRWGATAAERRANGEKR